MSRDFNKKEKIITNTKIFTQDLKLHSDGSQCNLLKKHNISNLKQYQKHETKTEEIIINTKNFIQDFETPIRWPTVQLIETKHTNSNRKQYPGIF